MTSPSATQDIELQERVDAPPEAVFPFLVEGERMARWFGRHAEIDARPGGTLRVDINGRDIARGEIVEVVPNERVVFTFGWEAEGGPVPAGSTRVEISLRADGDATVVTLRHSGLPEAEAGGHKEGWAHYTPRLKDAAEGRDPGPDSFAEPREM